MERELIEPYKMGSETTMTKDNLIVHTDNLKRPYFKNLDVFRFFAAFFVLCGHCFTGSLNYLNLPFPISNLFSLIGNGGVWVSFFFVLSGFLIGYISFFEKIDQEFNIKNFLIRRILRIWPLYYVMLFLGFIAFPLAAKLFFEIHYTYNGFWKYAVFFGNDEMIDVYKFRDFTLVPNMVSTTWSISIEEQFYVVLAILVVICSLKWLKWLLVLALLIGFYFVASNGGQSFLHFHSLYYLFDFSLGCLAAYAILLNKSIKQILERYNRLILILITSLGIIGVLTYSNEDFIQQKISYALFFVLVVYFASFSNNAIMNKIGNIKPLSYLGKISYGIYLIHPFFQYFFFVGVNKLYPASSQLWKDLVVLSGTLTLTFIFASLSYQYFEKYFLRLKQRFY